MCIEHGFKKFWSYKYLVNYFLFIYSVKPEHYLNTMDFLQAIRETQEKMWWLCELLAKTKSVIHKNAKKSQKLLSLILE